MFSQWERIFKDPMTTLAAIDRVVHHVVLDLMAVESYRAKGGGREVENTSAAANQRTQGRHFEMSPPVKSS